MRHSLSSVLRVGFAACAILLSLLAPPAVDAAGLGRMTVLSTLGQPLNAEIELNATKDELSTMQVRIASAEAYRRANLDYSAFVASVRLAIEQRRDGSLIVRATSPRPVNDPFIELMVELVWASGRLVREYTSLIDPPGFVAGDPVSPPVVVAPTAPPVASTSPALAAPPAPAAAPLEPVAPAAPPPPPRIAAVEKPAPAAAPAPRSAPPPAPAAAAGPAAGSDSYGPVRRGETLSRIAESVRPAGVSLDQMLVTLFRENKAAFDGNNMNRLRTGAVLRVPDAAAATATSPGEATREVRVQAADFNAYRQRLAGAVQDAPPVAEGGQVAAGRISPKVEEKAPAPAGGTDVLRLSKGEPAKGPGAVDAKAAAAAREEDATAREKALREANERVAALEKMLKDAQRLLEIQNRQLAELQKLAKAEPAKPAPAPAPEPPKPAEVKPEPVQPEAAKPEPVAPAPTVDTAAPEPVAPPVAEAPPPVAKPEPRPVPPPPPPAPPPSLLDQALAFVTNYAMELGGGLLALLGLVWLAVKRKGGSGPRRPARAAAASDTPVEPVAVPAPAPVAPERLTDSMAGTEPRAAFAVEEDIDPLAEAEVYLTHGRDSQAEAILREAIADTPGRPELYLKLLEIYMKRPDARAFEAVATDLFAATGGQGPDWLKAAEMGISIDPENPLYAAARSAGGDDGSGPGAGPLAGVAGATAAAAAATVAAVATARASIDNEKTQVLTVDDTRPAAPPAEPVEPEPPFPAEVASVDFDFEPVAPVQAQAGTDAGPGEVGAAEPPAITAADMDFTLDFGVPETASVPELPDLPLEPSLDGTATVEADLTFEPMTGNEGDATSLAEPMYQSQATNVLLESGPPTGSILDFKLEAARAEAEESAAEPTMAGSGQPTLPPMAQDTMIMANPGELVTFDMTHPAGLPQNWQETTLPRVDLDLGETSPDGRSMTRDEHWNDVNTKYDLAKAYEEMGDKDGAREILREVIAEGDEQQKADAEAMLARLG